MPQDNQPDNQPHAGQPAAPQAERPATPLEQAQPQAQQPVLPQHFSWNELSQEVKAGLESLLTENKAPLFLFGRAMEMGSRPDRESQMIGSQAQQALKSTIEWHYKAIASGPDAANHATATLQKLFDEQTPNNVRNGIFRLLGEIGKKVYEAAPDSKKNEFGQKLYKSSFEAGFQIKFDAWQNGSLIDNLTFDNLDSETKEAFLQAFRDEPLSKLTQEHMQYQMKLAKMAQAGQIDPQVAEMLQNKIEASGKKLEKYALAAIKAYGFSNNFADFVKNNKQVLDVILPLFKFAAKKIALTLGADKVKEISKYKLQQQIGNAYGSPQAQEGQAE